MAFLIDASVFITLERRGFAPADIALVAQEEPPAIATITAAELLFGVYRADTPDRRSRRAAYVESIFGLVEVVPFDLAAARTHARIWADLAAAGTPIGPNDLVLAACALTLAVPLLTENLREFRRVPDLVVLQPAWPN